MALAFPRSLRALGNDRFRPSLIMLGITAGLLIAWLGWFFLSQIPINVTSSTYQVTRNGVVTATFSAAALAQIAAQQPATLAVSVPNEPPKTYDGQVVRVDTAARTGNGAENQLPTPPTVTQGVTATTPATGTAQIYFSTLAQLPAAATGTVQVQVESVSPASLLLRAVRQSAASLSAAPPAK